MDLSKYIKPAAEQPQAEAPQQMTKEEYAALKKAEREEVWARVDGQAEAVFKDSASMQAFLDFVAACTPQSTRNLLILYEQNPEIRHPRTFEKWKEAGRSVITGETGYTFFTEQNYTREDGTAATGYALVKAFDISQTRGPQPAAETVHAPEELLAALIEQSPVRLELSDQLPDRVQAQYVPRQHTIFVRNDMDETAAFCSVVREQAHASFDTVGRGYTRQAFAAQSYCAAYIAAKKFGIDTSAFRFDKVCEIGTGLDTQGKRAFLSDVKSAAYTVSRGIRSSLREVEQTIQPDAFSVEAPRATAKPARAKAEKNKADESR